MIDIARKIRHFAVHSSILWRNPGALPMVARGYFNALALGRPVLRTVEFAVTAQCNVNCPMCYATKLVDRTREPLTPDEYAAIWAQARKLGAFSAHLSGGEPTMRKDLEQIIRALDPGRTIVSMTTNATLLSGPALEKLRKAGLSVLHFSLNSLDAEDNDRERDFKGHLARVVESIALAKGLGFEVCLSVVVSHSNLAMVERLTRFAEEKGAGIVFSLATPAGNWDGAFDQLLTPEDWARVDGFMAANPHVRSDWTINLSMRKGCPAGYEKVSVSPYGDVQGCAMSFVAHGNLRDEPLADIWRRMLDFEPYRRRSPVCLIGLDRDFIDSYLAPVNALDRLPVRVEDHPTRPLRAPGDRPA